MNPSKKRDGIKPVATPNTAAIAVNMPFTQFMKYLGVTVKPEVAKNMDLKVNIHVAGDGEYAMDLSNSVLKSYSDKQFEAADLTINLTRQVFENLITKNTTLQDEMKSGHFTVSDKTTFQQLISVFDQFELWFGVVTP